jgi:hypothetical protein
MSRKNQNIVCAEVVVSNNENSERDHLFEHMHFLEERTTRLEQRVQILGDIFTSLMNLDEEEEEEDDEDEYDEEEEESNELRDFIANCCCIWSNHRV